MKDLIAKFEALLSTNEYKFYADGVEDCIKVIEQQNKGEISDGYHTFNELYDHRAILFSALCNQNAHKAWKARKHDDGTMYKDMFIVGIETPTGQATYHYDINPYWELFKVKELESAPKWDGHTPSEAIERIKQFGLESHKTRQPIQVTEGDFKCDEIGDFHAFKGEVKITIWNVEYKRHACQIWYKGYFIFSYDGELLKDGVIAVNEALKKMYEDVSEVME
jgi:hypothetical protein